MTASVSILGAGNGGFATAADLARRGVGCTLFELPAFEQAVASLRVGGRLRLTGVLGEADLPAPRVTTDIRDAVVGADVIVVAVPAFAQETFARLCAPHVAPDQVIVLTPGATGGAIAFVAALGAAGAPRGVVVAETLSLPYACRKTAPDQVHIAGVKRGLPVAAMPATDTTRTMAALETVFPGVLVPAAHVLETSLNNPNAMAHPVPALLNAGWIETTGGDFRFYTDGVSPSVATAIDTIDGERMRILEALGLPRVPAIEWDRRLYGLEGETTYELNQRSWVHVGIRAPAALRTRYITEDVPFGLVPIASIGRELGVATPALDIFIDLASMLVGEDLRQGGRTAASLGLEGLDAEGMVARVSQG
jgi:opine dehydrogenase